MVALAKNIYKTDLLEKGYRVYPLGEYGITKEQFNLIKVMTDPAKIDYEQVISGDTKEPSLAQILRLKHPANINTKQEECIALFEDKPFQDFIKEETHITKPFIDRIQTHFYKVNGFLGKHVDAESADYLFSCIFVIEPAGKGGELVVYPDGQPIPLDLNAGDLLVLDAHVPHEVLAIEKGARKSLCLWVN